MQLTKTDVNFVLSRMPLPVRELIESKGLYVAGGFIRSVISGERVSDIDIFGGDKLLLENAAYALALPSHAKIIKTDNAITVLGACRYPVQFITRWLFSDPVALVKSFDFTVCQSCLYKDTLWKSEASDGFYIDLAARRLVYSHPERHEDVGGSLMRAIKFVKRGYSIQAPSIAGVVSRLMTGVRKENVNIEDESAVARVLVGLLREVDPAIVSEEDADPIPETENE
jgi:hypothetical protein